MEQNSGSQNKTTEFILKNQITIIVVALIAILAIIYFVTRGSDNTDSLGGQQAEQNGGDNGSQGEENQNDDAGTTPDTAAKPQAGNVAASGILRESDNTARGNLMVESGQGNIYIATQRDFSALLGKSVTLNANGSINKFEFLGFNEAAELTDEGAMGGGEGSTAGAVAWNGILRKSDDSSKGNYMVTSGSTAVYLKSARDYSAWLGSNVHLNAEGSLASFNNAVLTKA